MTERPTGDDLDVPLFSIGTVARETGLPPTTLRTWEERYGGVIPHRDVSGQRLYTRRQIGELAWIKQQVEAGFKPSEAHRLLRGAFQARSPSPDVTLLEEPHVRFLIWTSQSRTEILDVLSRVRTGTGAMSAFLSVNLPHPEFGLMSSTMVRATTPERLDDGTLARFGGVAWSLLAEIRDVLARGDSIQFGTESLGSGGRELYAPTDIRSQLLVPLRFRTTWLGSIGVTSPEKRIWTEDDIRRTEQARDLLQADHEAYVARARFGQIVGVGSDAVGPAASAAAF